MSDSSDLYKATHPESHDSETHVAETHVTETHLAESDAAETHGAQSTATGTVVAHDINDDADGKAFRLYMAALDRTPDSAGLANWMSVIRSGVDMEHVANGFVTSTEFQQKYGSLDNAQFVDQMYQNVLHRSADASGQANWLHALESGQTRESVLVGFSESAENQAHAAALVNGVSYQAWVG